MVSGSDINATVGQAAPKSALVGLGKLGATVDSRAKAIKMDTLALQDAGHHPAESFQVTDIAPLDVTPDAVRHSLDHKDGKLKSCCC